MTCLFGAFRAKYVYICHFLMSASARLLILLHLITLTLGPTNVKTSNYVDHNYSIFYFQILDNNL